MEALCLAALMVSLGVLSLGHLRLKRGLNRPPPRCGRPEVYPSVTVIRPIRGLDVGAEQNVRSLLALDYPADFEVLFILDGEDDPAYASVKEWVQTMPTRARRAEVLVAGHPAPGHTGKLNAMQRGVAESRGTLLAFSDSDTRPEPHLLTRSVEALLDDPRAGAAFPPIYATADEPRVGDVAYGIVVKAWYAPSLHLARGPAGEMPFIMGQLMVLRREALDAVGGLGCLEGQLVDDMFLGKRLAEAGWENRLVVDTPLRVVTGGMGLRDFLQFFTRWMLFSKSGLAFSFTRPNWERGAACVVGWLCLPLAIGLHSTSATLAAVAVLAFTVFSEDRLQRACRGGGLRWRHLWLAAFLPVLSAGAAAATLRTRRVTWRGRTYALDAGARLELGRGAGSRS